MPSRSRPAAVRRGALAATALAALVCAGAAQADETVSVPAFRSIELRGGGHVTLRHGDVQRVTLTRGSTRYTKFHVKDDGQLVIDACNRDCPWVYRLAITIETPAIGGVAVSGGGDIEAESGFARQPKLAAAVSGGGGIDVRAIPATRASAAVSGGGHIRLRALDDLHAAVDGGGKIAMRSGEVAEASATVSGGGAIRVAVAKRLDAAVNAGGSIRYWGHPKVSSAIAGGGTVESGE